MLAAPSGLPHRAGGSNASLELSRAFATLRLLPSAGTGQGCRVLADDVREAAAELERQGAKVQTVFVEITGPAVTRGHPGAAFAEPQEQVPGACAEELEKLTSLLRIGLVDRPTSVAETCMLASCSFVLATPEAEFALFDSRASPVVVPLGLLRNLGPAVAEHLAGGRPATIRAGQAQKLGLVTEIVGGSLQDRKEELSNLLMSYTSAASALRRWPNGRPTWGTQLPAQGSNSSDRPAGGVKRPARWPLDGQAAGKRQRQLEDPRLRKCNTVVAALLDGQGEAELEDCSPPGARALLQRVVSGSLSVPRGQREAFQEEVISLASKALEARVSELRRLLSDAQASVDGADAVGAAREGAEAAAEARLVTLGEVVTKKKNKLREDTNALREAASALESMSTQQKAGDEGFDAANEQKEQLEAAQQDMYQPLKDGAFTKPKAKKTAAALVALGKKFEFDETLLVGLPEVLTMKPGERGAFDSMVLSAFETQIATRIAELETTLAEGAPDRERREAAVSRARAAHEAAGRVQRRSCEALEAAKASYAEGEQNLAKARACVAAYASDLRLLESQRDDALGRLLAFQQGPVADFEDLRRTEDTAGTLPAAELTNSEAAAVEDAAAAAQDPAPSEPLPAASDGASSLERAEAQVAAPPENAGPELAAAEEARDAAPPENVGPGPAAAEETVAGGEDAAAEDAAAEQGRSVEDGEARGPDEDGGGPVPPSSPVPVHSAAWAAAVSGQACEPMDLSPTDDESTPGDVASRQQHHAVTDELAAGSASAAAASAGKEDTDNCAEENDPGSWSEAELEAKLALQAQAETNTEDEDEDQDAPEAP